MKIKLLFLMTLCALQGSLMMVAAEEPRPNQQHKEDEPPQQLLPVGNPDLSFFDDWIAELEGKPKKKEEECSVRDLIRAAENNDIAAILEYRGDVNEMVGMRPEYNYRLNALHAAIHKGHKEAVEVLLKQKHADPNLCAEEIKGRYKGSRALDDAYYRSKTFCGDKKSPLQWAIGDITSINDKKINKDIILLLLKAGANPNVVDCFGYPPLYFAANYGLTEIALWMIDAGANPEQKFSVGSLFKYEEPKSYRGDRPLDIYTRALPATADAIREYFAYKRASMAFLAISHSRCGANSTWNELPSFVVQQIVNYSKPSTVQEEYTGRYGCLEQNCVYRTNELDEFFQHQEQCGHYEKMDGQLCGPEGILL